MWNNMYVISFCDFETWSSVIEIWKKKKTFDFVSYLLKYLTEVKLV